jgi:hypothetical protein
MQATAQATFRPPPQSNYQMQATPQATFRPPSQSNYQMQATPQATFSPLHNMNPPPPSSTFMGAARQNAPQPLRSNRADQIRELNASNAELARQNERMRQTIQLCFMVDMTGTMRKWLEVIQETVISIISNLKKEFSLDDETIQVALVGYSDYDQSVPPKSRTIVVDFGNAEKLHNDLKRMKKLDGEGIKMSSHSFLDTPEDVISGLDKVLKLSWKTGTKMLVHMGKTV